MAKKRGGWPRKRKRNTKARVKFNSMVESANLYVLQNERRTRNKK